MEVSGDVDPRVLKLGITTEHQPVYLCYCT